MTTATHSPALDAVALLHEAQQLAPQVIDWRRALHQRPEVAFQEHETARFIREVLEQIGDLEISRPTETSVMARLHTGRPGPVLAVRADIDALPIHEENDVEYRSQTDGAMHACGHDGHTSIALGLVTLLARHRELLRGEIRFLFQHAEELSPGGAEAMVQQGVMDGVDHVIGLHVWSAMPVGRIGLIAGPAMAAPDTFECTIIGQGGHAAIPHGTIDPIAIGAQVVSALQHVVSRTVDPLDPAVLSVTQFIAGTTFNVIPNTAYLAGTHSGTLVERVSRIFDRDRRALHVAIRHWPMPSGAGWGDKQASGGRHPAGPDPHQEFPHVQSRHLIEEGRRQRRLQRSRRQAGFD